MKWSCSRGLSPTLGGCWLSVCGLTVTSVHLTQVFIHCSFCERSLWCLLVFASLLGCQNHLLARAGLFRFAVLPRQVLAHRLAGKLCLTGVAKVPCQVQRLTWAQAQWKKNRNETKTPGKTKSKSCSQRQAEERKSESVRPKLLTFHQRGEQRDVGSFPPAGRQVEAQSV